MNAKFCIHERRNTVSYVNLTCDKPSDSMNYFLTNRDYIMRLILSNFAFGQ